MDKKSHSVGGIKKDAITVYVFHGATERKKFYLSYVFLWLLSLIGVLVFAGLIVTLIHVVDLSRSNKALSSKIAALEVSMNNPIAAVAEVEKPNENTDNQAESSDPPQEETAEQTAEAPSVTPSMPLDEVDSEVFDLSDISVIPEHGTSLINVSFGLNNLEQIERKSGYIFVLALTEDYDPASCSSFPASVTVDQNFNPVDARNGDYFSIQRFKQIQASLLPPSPEKNIKNIVITCYSSSGEILVRRIIDL
ncbi:hypothetical protein ACFLT9_11945 [Acidobacteriota bacterium]